MPVASLIRATLKPFGWRSFGAAGLLLGAFSGSSCGSRTSLDSAAFADAAEGGTSSTQTSCNSDAECGEAAACSAWRCIAGSCQAQAVSCDDGDPCTEDRCDAARGCEFIPLSVDSDGDGHTSPRAGYVAGTPNSCGDDCDDTSALAYPGRVEVCDGVDNDCNGVVDDGAQYVASSQLPTRVSSPTYRRAARAGLVAQQDSFALTYTGFDGSSHGLLKRVSLNGETLSESEVTRINADTYGGPLVWTGGVLATAWEDARQAQNYEIYFARFDALGRKLGPDLRVTNAENFSLNVTLRWNQSEYVLAWDDRRNAELATGPDPAHIFGQRISAEGKPLGDNVPLVVNEPGAQSPAIAVSPTRIALAYVTFTDDSYLGFRLFDATLNPVGSPTLNFQSGVEAPSVYWVGDRFFVIWGTSTGKEPGSSIWAASFDGEGRMLQGPRPVTEGARFARSPTALSLGDRLLLVWSDDYDGNYDLYTETLDRDLKVLNSRARLTSSPSPSLHPALATSPAGHIAVMFDDWQDSTRQVYFTALECKPPGLR